MILWIICTLVLMESKLISKDLSIGVELALENTADN